MESFPILIKTNGAPKAFRISKREKDILEFYGSGNSQAKCAEEFGMNCGDVSNFLGRPEIAEYLKTRLMQEASKVDLTPEKIITKINELVDLGHTAKIDPSYVRVLDLAARMMKLITNGVQINNNINTNPYADKTTEEMDAMMMERIKTSQELQH